MDPTAFHLKGLIFLFWKWNIRIGNNRPVLCRIRVGCMKFIALCLINVRLTARPAAFVHDANAQRFANFCWIQSEIQKWKSDEGLLVDFMASHSSVFHLWAHVDCLLYYPFLLAHGGLSVMLNKLHRRGGYGRRGQRTCSSKLINCTPTPAAALVQLSFAVDRSPPGPARIAAGLMLSF